jgi:hypothetical protein
VSLNVTPAARRKDVVLPAALEGADRTTEHREE